MARHVPTRKVKAISPAERPETLTEQAYKQIEELIVTLRLKPGHVLSEQSLSASLGIGRTPIREALQKLALEGLVTILQRKGILVSEINPQSQLRVLEVRRELERLLSRGSAERATEEDKERFLTIARGMEKAARTKQRYRLHASRSGTQSTDSRRGCRWPSFSETSLHRMSVGFSCA
jgi:DNA-binding GntR family transcriptional regulator